MSPPCIQSLHHISAIRFKIPAFIRTLSRILPAVVTDIQDIVHHFKGRKVIYVATKYREVGGNN
jgi:hypothetical protein